MKRCNTQGPTGPVDVILSRWETFWPVLINAVDGAVHFVQDEVTKAEEASAE